MYPAGQAGMALYSYKLANALAEKGLQVTLFVDGQYELDSLPAKFNKIKVLSSKNVSIGSNQPPIVRIANIVGAHLHNWREFYHYVKKDRPEIIHIQPQFYLVDWHILSHLKKSNTKLVLTVHDVIPHKFYTRHFGWLELLILKYMYNKADRLIVHAENNKQQLLASFSVDEHRVVVIPHGEYSLDGISEEISDKGARSKLNLDDNDKVILYFGYIRKIKGIDVLLKAFDRVAENFPDTILMITGSVIQGESFSEYRQIIDEMKYRRRVKCFGKYVHHKDIHLFFKAADIVVLPYIEFHSQSGVLHLAHGFGKPVIVSNVGGLPEVVEDHETGLIVPPGDVNRLAEAIGYLMENERLRTKMGQRAREIAMERFSWGSIAKATIEKAYR
jgi:glycosyltransferase involved in cell wall biosynthesis